MLLTGEKIICPGGFSYMKRHYVPKMRTRAKMRYVVDDRVRRENLVNQILGYKVRRLLSFFLSSPFFRMDNG